MVTASKHQLKLATSGPYHSADPGSTGRPDSLEGYASCDWGPELVAGEWLEVTWFESPVGIDQSILAEERIQELT